MKHDELDHILSLCKEKQQKRQENAGEFSCEKMKADFRKKREESITNHFPILKLAALFFLILLAGSILFFALPEKKASPSNLYADIAGMFEPDAIAVMVGDELVTCELDASVDRSRLNTYSVPLPDGKMLTFRCNDGDSLSLDSGNIKGVIVVSRADADTTVIDITLKITGKQIRKIVVVDA